MTFEDFINDNLFLSVEISPHVKELFSIPEIDNIDLTTYNMPTNTSAQLQQKIEYSLPTSNDRVQRVVENAQPTQRVVRGTDAFEHYYDEVEKEVPEAKKYRRILTAIAESESGFNPEIQNLAGAPAWGYFQFMQGNYRGVNHNNVYRFSGLTIDQFLKNPKAQIKAAIKLALQFDRSLTLEDRDKINRKGLTQALTMYAMWFAGLGGFRKYLNTNANLTDGAGGNMLKVLEKMKGV